MCGATTIPTREKSKPCPLAWGYTPTWVRRSRQLPSIVQPLRQFQGDATHPLSPLQTNSASTVGSNVTRPASVSESQSEGGGAPEVNANWIYPLTWRVLWGLVVPMPTLPALSISIRVTSGAPPRTGFRDSPSFTRKGSKLRPELGDKGLSD